MLLHLAEHLEIPLRARNVLLNAAGYAPTFPERRLDDPALAAARQAIELILKGHEPYPALAIDRHWTLVASNEAVLRLLDGTAPALLQPPVNVLRLSLHPNGLAPRIANLREWRSHLLARLSREIDASADPILVELMRELRDYPAPGRNANDPAASAPDPPGIVVPLQLVTKTGLLSLFSTTTVFGTPTDITLSELALEAFYPADAATAEALQAARARSQPSR